MKVKWSDQLAEELHKPVVKSFRKRRVYVKGIDEIWAADLIDMQSFAEYNEGFKYLLSVVNIFSKYGWIVPLKDKSGKSVSQAFEKIFTSSERKPKKLWVDKGTHRLIKCYKMHCAAYLNDCVTFSPSGFRNPLLSLHKLTLLFHDCNQSAAS